MRRFAISDIHGCLRTFQALLEKIEFSKTDELYLLGDYIDRGPDSKGVIDFIWELQEKGFKVHCLVGNHELMLLQAANDDSLMPWWARNGGTETMQSFGLFHPRQFPSKYLQFFAELPYYHEVDNFLLVHAGFSFEKDNPFNDQKSMAWIRGWYESLNREWLGNRIIVHGHTPATASTIRYQLQHLDQFPVLVIDNGCVYNRPGLGYLAALEMTELEMTFERRWD